MAHPTEGSSNLGHTKWRPAVDRPDPVALLEDQDANRMPGLVPVRHGRMMVSPFTFYRGAAAIMTAVLRETPVAGLDAQLCGDAHLSNFGAFASPERRLLFDLNDFDETLPGPFEYDVKRMAASFTIAARNNGFSRADTRDATMASAASYRQAMAAFAQMRTMDVWYAHLDEDQVMSASRGAAADLAKQAKKGSKAARKQAKKQAEEAKRANKAGQKAAQKAHTRDSLQALSKLGELVDGKYRIVSQPPIVIPARDLAPMSGVSAGDLDQVSASSSGPTGPPCGRTSAACLTASRSSTWPTRWSASAASSGDPIAIAACLGDGDEFDKSITDFSRRYADQNERDYQQFADAVGSGRLEALEGV